jgi:methyl-accepting chemotaxis protein
MLRRRLLRLMLLTPVLLIVLGIIVAFGLQEQRRSAIDSRKEHLKDLVEVARSVTKIWHQKEISGSLTRDQAQQGARDEIWQLRFANNYFFIQRYDGIAMLAADRTLEGKNRLGSRDLDGAYPVRDLSPRRSAAATSCRTASAA